jgi:hypothetical protein
VSIYPDGDKLTVRYNLGQMITSNDIPYPDNFSIDTTQPVIIKISYDETDNKYRFAITQDQEEKVWNEHIVESSQKLHLGQATKLSLFNSGSFYEESPLKLYMNDTYFKVEDEYVFKCF